MRLRLKDGGTVSLDSGNLAGVEILDANGDVGYVLLRAHHGSAQEPSVMLFSADDEDLAGSYAKKFGVKFCKAVKLPDKLFHNT